MEAPAVEAEAAAPEAVHFEIVYEDDAPARGGQARRRWSRTRRRGTAGPRSPRRWRRPRGWRADPERAGIVHRLDRDTSGLLVVARPEEAHAALQSMMKAREVTREYLALVEGHPDAESGTIDAPIGRDRARPHRHVHAHRPRRATRSPISRCCERLPRTTLLRVRLETGRTHQIRAHLAAIGHPVVRRPPVRRAASAAGRLGLKRQFLHAAKLMFRHPFNGEIVACESKPPAELRRALDAARREPVSGGPDGD